MYSHVHGVVGAIAYTASPDPITGSIAAFVSHFLMDYLNEKNYGSDKFFLQLELSHLVAFGFLGFLSGHFWAFFLGWFWGNLPDLIDKRLFYFHKKGQEQYFSCHNYPGWKIGKHRIGIFSFNDWKLGAKSIYNFTLEQTVAIGVFDTALLSIWTYVITLGWIKVF